MTLSGRRKEKEGHFTLSVRGEVEFVAEVISRRKKEKLPSRPTGRGIRKIVFERPPHPRFASVATFRSIALNPRGIQIVPLGGDILREIDRYANGSSRDPPSFCYCSPCPFGRRRTTCVCITRECAKVVSSVSRVLYVNCGQLSPKVILTLSKSLHRD